MPDTPGQALLAWFYQNKRDMPWRRSRDPYAIWISEIMLQQTRTAAALDHYDRWMKRFPDVASLAAAGEPEVLALWSGLGYYRRVRMLHRAAQMVVESYNGALPQASGELRKLPGIGEYTSAAIASIAFGEPIAVVDGNVERVIIRMDELFPKPAASNGESEEFEEAPLGVPEESSRKLPGELSAPELLRAIRAGAQALLDPEHAGDSNQAMMELGATVCLPRAPRCLYCPVQPWCRTRGEHPRTASKPQLRRATAYALVMRDAGIAPDGFPLREVLLVQRGAGESLMAGMWELPEIPEPLSSFFTNTNSQVHNHAVPGRLPVLRLKHAITTTNFTISIVAMEESELPSTEGMVWQSCDELPGVPLTGLARKVFMRLDLWPNF